MEVSDAGAHGVVAGRLTVQVGAEVLRSEGGVRCRRAPFAVQGLRHFLSCSSSNTLSPLSSYLPP